MARSVFTENLEPNLEVEEEMTDLPRVKQFVRYLGAVTNEGTQAIQEVDEEINAWLANGYKIIATHAFGMDTTLKAYVVLYILLRE